MNSIDIDILNALQTVTQCYNDLITKYNKLEMKYFNNQMNIWLIRSNVIDLTYSDIQEHERINRILELIDKSIDRQYIKEEKENDK